MDENVHEEMKKMTEEGQKKEGKIGKRINFEELFRVKGMKGIYTIGSKLNKSGMIKMNRFLSEKESVIIKHSNIAPLSSIVYYTEMGFNNLRINDVFDNLVDFYGSEEWKKDNKLVPELSDFVPNYDPKMFKEHQALKVMVYFDEIITKMTELNGVEKEDKTKN